MNHYYFSLKTFQSPHIETKSESGTSGTFLINFQSPYIEQIESENYQIETCFGNFVYPCRITKY